jgi:hypothetical protein
LGHANSAVTGRFAPVQSFFGVVYEHREGFGVGRPSGSLNSSCKKKPEFFLVDGEVPMQPLFSPEAPSLALPPPSLY